MKELIRVTKKTEKTGNGCLKAINNETRSITEKTKGMKQINVELGNKH